MIAGFTAGGGGETFGAGFADACEGLTTTTFSALFGSRRNAMAIAAATATAAQGQYDWERGVSRGKRVTGSGLGSAANSVPTRAARPSNPARSASHAAH